MTSECTLQGYTGQPLYVICNSTNVSPCSFFSCDEWLRRWKIVCCVDVAGAGGWSIGNGFVMCSGSRNTYRVRVRSLHRHGETIGEQGKVGFTVWNRLGNRKGMGQGGWQPLPPPTSYPDTRPPRQMQIMQRRLCIGLPVHPVLLSLLCLWLRMCDGWWRHQLETARCHLQQISNNKNKLSF